MLVPSEGGIFIYMITKKCLECGIEFEKITKISKKQWKLRKFCSQKCHYTFKKGKYFTMWNSQKKSDEEEKEKECCRRAAEEEKASLKKKQQQTPDATATGKSD